MDAPDIIDYNALKVLTDICGSTLLDLAEADSLPPV
jgi:hypothetical protein